MIDNKITFPKLKCVSERQNPLTKKYTNPDFTTISTQQARTQMYGKNLHERLNNLKVKYVSKSPNYFKLRNRSLQTIQCASNKYKTVAKYLEQKSRIFDKETLLQVARSRVKKVRVQQYELFKKDKQLRQDYETLQQNETKYSNFSPSRFPIKHAIKNTHHQQLTLPIRLSQIFYVLNLFKSLSMQPMQDQNCSVEFEEIYYDLKSPQDIVFDQIIAALQQIMIDIHFEKTLCGFMKHHWSVFDENSTKEAQLKVFGLYRGQLQNYLQKILSQRIPDFNWQSFRNQVQTRRNIIDEQILDTLLSFDNLDNFKLFIKDFRNSFQEEELLQTIKTNKVSQNKKVKGKDSIFAATDNQTTGLFDKGLKAPLQKKKALKQKSQQQLFVPQLILTVRPYRKN